MQSNVIDANSQKHTVKPYRFKILSAKRDNVELKEHLPFCMLDEKPSEQEAAQKPANASEQPSPTNEQAANSQQENAPQDNAAPQNAPQATPAAQTAATPEPQPSFIEELLKRTDELSDNIIKLQMKIESQESEFKERLASETDKARKEGEQAGADAARAAYEAQLNELEAKYGASIKKLDEQSAKFGEFLAKTEEQLSHTAIDIAKEVVLKEIKENSAKVAFNIAKSLINELRDAASVEIKVNSKDYAYLSEQFEGQAHIKLSSDDAISPGGALLLSDSGNIDGTIKTRFEKIRKILSE